MEYSSVEYDQFSSQFNSPTITPTTQTTPTTPQTIPQPTQSTTKTQPTTIPKNKKNVFVAFLNDNKGTLIMAAMGLSIGFAFKDFIKECAEYIIGIFIYLFNKVKKTGKPVFNVNIFKVFNSFLSLLLIIIFDYYIYKML
jgi:hypothetical protein